MRWHAVRGCAGHRARRWIECARLRCRRSRSGESARAGRYQSHRQDRVRADAAVTINGLVRWMIVHGAPPDWKHGRARPGNGWRRHPRQCTLCREVIGELRHRGTLVDQDGRIVDVRTRGHGVRLRSKSTQQHGRSADLGDLSRSTGRTDCAAREGRASLAYRKRTQPLDVRAAVSCFRILNRVRSGAGRDSRSAGALVDRAGLKGTAIGGARVSLERTGISSSTMARRRPRHPPFDRTLPDRRARAIRRDLKEEISLSSLQGPGTR